MRRPVVGVMASSATTLAPAERAELERLAERLGEAIARRGLVVLTGETTGLPHAVARAASRAGALTVGVSGAHSRAEQLERYPAPDESSDVVIYTGMGLKGRNVVSVRSCDVVLVMAGSIGTLNEFTIAYDEGKVIGVLTGTGGVADRLEGMLAACPKPTKSTLVYSPDAEDLVARCLEHLPPAEGWTMHNPEGSP